MSDDEIKKVVEASDMVRAGLFSEAYEVSADVFNVRHTEDGLSNLNPHNVDIFRCLVLYVATEHRSYLGRLELSEVPEALLDLIKESLEPGLANKLFPDGKLHFIVRTTFDSIISDYQFIKYLRNNHF